MRHEAFLVRSNDISPTGKSDCNCACPDVSAAEVTQMSVLLKSGESSVDSSDCDCACPDVSTSDISLQSVLLASDEEVQGNRDCDCACPQNSNAETTGDTILALGIDKKITKPRVKIKLSK